MLVSMNDQKLNLLQQKKRKVRLEIVNDNEASVFDDVNNNTNCETSAIHIDETAKKSKASDDLAPDESNITNNKTNQLNIQTTTTTQCLQICCSFTNFNSN